MKLTVIGDVHGKTKTYQKLVRKLGDQHSVQIGDMGIGFKGVGLHKMPAQHRWFRGNHDDPAKCKLNPNYLGDYGFDAEWNTFWLAGAHSIDREMRIEGVSWWKDEQLSYAELDAAITLYIASKPKYVLTHEAPQKAGAILLADLIGPYFAAKSDCIQSRTSQALQSMFEFHKPKEWVFGHYHVNKSFMLDGTKFTCVAELSKYELDI